MVINTISCIIFVSLLTNRINMIKKTTLSVLAVLATTLGFSQNGPIDFETGGQGANWTWTVFENSTNPALTFIANPDMSGDNTSATVAKFTALQAGNPYAGCESSHGNIDLGTFVLDTTNSIIKIMVWKTSISDVGMKLISAKGWALPELKVANKLINKWEELTFDFSSFANPPASQGLYDQIVVFPDYIARTKDNIVYFDNISFNSITGGSGGGGGVKPAEPSAAAPVPTRIDSNVISVFSDTYTDIAGVDFNPGWGQSTVVKSIQIKGNNTYRYNGLNYQGIDLNGTNSVSEMEYLHVDIWSANSTALNVFLISSGPVETPSAIVTPTAGWLSVDISLTDFTPVDLNDIIQLKFDGNGDIFMDNLYFYKKTSIVDTIVEEPNFINESFLNGINQLYPNPVISGNEVRFIEEISHIELLDLSGRLLKKENNNVISTIGLDQGTYVVRATNLVGKVSTQQLIIK